MTHREEANLTDVAVTAKASVAAEELDWPDSPEARRLGLTPQKMATIIDSYQKRIESLTTILR